LALLTARLAGAAESTPGSGVTATPTRMVAADGLALAVAHRDAWRKSRQKLLADDFGETAHYRKANAALPPPPAGEPRVIFRGDSICEGWYFAGPFPGKAYVGRGIGGPTTSAVLVRVLLEVLGLGPAAWVTLLRLKALERQTGA